MYNDIIKEIIDVTKLNIINEKEGIDLIKQYYLSHEMENELINALMYYKIAIFIIQDELFKLDINYLKYIHFTIFNDVYNDAGRFRDHNIKRREECLHLRSVIYSTHDMIKENLEYDFYNEKNKSYKGKSTDEKVHLLSMFISNIWQAHPFSNGNTRCDMIFLQKYLENLDIDYNTHVFDNNFNYFRNALVRSNYNTIGFIDPTYEYLEKIIYNLITGKTQTLDINETIVPEEKMLIKHR